MISLLRALFYYVCHPGDTVHITVVRRYADAQKHFIGELYIGEGRDAKMIGWSCDNLPLEVKPKTKGRVRWGQSFLDPMSPNTILTGGQDPEETAKVHEYVSTRRFCTSRVTISNRFVEHILESDHVG